METLLGGESNKVTKSTSNVAMITLLQTDKYSLSELLIVLKSMQK